MRALSVLTLLFAVSLAMAASAMPPETAWDQRAAEEVAFKAAMDHLHRGEAAEAVDSFRHLAVNGHSAAQINLAILYTRGEGVPSDRLAATRWAWRARLMGDRRAASLSDALLEALPARSRNVVADRLREDLEALAAAGAFQAFLALGRLEAEVRTPPRLDDAGVWLMLAAAFEVSQARRMRDRLIAGVTDARRLSMEARAGEAFTVWCDRLTSPARPVTCPAPAMATDG
ncbi:MAG: SEL1-like repeat protein [Rhodobacteraceae bacterium]|nr:SEL1-like repeat protein [Paracoccaceae bacterium]